jgi:quercetin 2,3-dioxygenase
MTHAELPGKPSPYKLDAGEGQRFTFGGQLATVIARNEDLGTSMAGTILSGGKGEHFPLHRHASTHEAMYVVEGSISFTLGDKTFVLSPGDYINIPPGTAHGFSYIDHRGKLLSWAFGGNANTIYSVIGELYAGTVYSELLPAVNWSRPLDGVDVEFVEELTHTAAPSTEKLDHAPGGVVPFVLAGGEGERMLAAEQLYTIMGTENSSDGLFVSLMTEGPIGPAIPKHLHEKVAETFFCLNGAMEMFAGDRFVALEPGDFLYIPPSTPHSFRLLKNGTRFIGFLTPGNFETFFRYLCQPFDGYMYPLVPPPFCFDRVIQHLSELDLKILERPGGPPPSASPSA